MAHAATRAARGALGGVVATAAMSVVLLVAKRAGWLGKMPPKIITDRGLDESGIRPVPESARSVLATLAHFGFGAAAGALHGLVASSPRHPIAKGLLTGSAVYTTSYAGWVPAAGILPPPDRDRPDRQATLLIGHAVFGAVLGWSYGRMNDRKARPWRR